MLRRRFLQIATVSALSLSTNLARAVATAPVKAVVFDGFVIFDPRPIAILAESLFPGRGTELITAWRLRQFEYCWLRNSMHQYADFWTVTREALVFAADNAKLDLNKEKRDQLMNSLLQMKAYPDVQPALHILAAAGIRLGFLSNLTEAMLVANLKSAGLEGNFEQLLSTDRVRVYKPEPRAYQMGIEAFNLPKEAILFAAFGGWDAAGAKSFGYKTYWVNRLHLPVEQLGVEPDAIGDMAGLVEFVNQA